MMPKSAKALIHHLSRLVVFPVALVLTYISIPFPFNLLAAICLAMIFNSLALLSKRLVKLTIAIVTLPFWGFILLVLIGWDFVPSLAMLSLIFSLYYWFSLADLRDKRLFHPTMLAAAGLLFSVFFLVGWSSQRLFWTPYPSWCRRYFLKKADYRSLQTIFGKRLPASFTISNLYYPGYNLIFNGPDGPLTPWYAIKVNAPDYASLISGLKLEEKESTFAIDRMSIFLKDESLSGAVRDAYYPKQELPQWVRVYELQPHKPESYWAPGSAGATLIVDTRSSPAYTLYVSTREPYRRFF